MPDLRNWQFELEEYIRQGEPDQVERSAAWKTAIGLQDVDGLKVSDYLLDTAKEHIEGSISIGEAQKRIETYYEERTERFNMEDESREADTVSTRIAELLGEKTFQFSPAEWLLIHRRIFAGVFAHAGQIRPYNISKKEWILKGETVTYASCGSIKDTMDYDFQTEKSFSYQGLSMSEVVEHLAKFTADIWQIHPFCEGNTRATAVFMIKYMRALGFEVSNELFAEKSWYFRNALVRANYNDLKNGIHATTKYLEMFFSNLLMRTKYELKNRQMHVDYVADQVQEKAQSANFMDSKCHFDTLNCTLDERELLELIVREPSITQMVIAERTGKSLRTVKRIMAEMQEKGIVRRVNGKRNGWWEV